MLVDWVVVGLDNGGTTNNGTILDSAGRFLLDRLAEVVAGRYCSLLVHFPRLGVAQRPD